MENDGKSLKMLSKKMYSQPFLDGFVQKLQCCYAEKVNSQKQQIQLKKLVQVRVKQVHEEDLGKGRR